jgi:hypothetical protein
MRLLLGSTLINVAGPGRDCGKDFNPMPRRSKFDIEAIRSASDRQCPHCPQVLSAAEYLRLEHKRLRCSKCGRDFEPERSGPAMRTS